VPVVVVEATVKVRVEVPEPGAPMGLVPKLKVTPVGRVAGPVKVIPALNPFKAVVVIVDVPVFPRITVSEEGEAEMEKLGVGGPDSALIRAAPFILPQPVTKS